MIHVESVEFVPRKLLMYLIIIFLGEMFCFFMFFSLYVMKPSTKGQMFVFNDDDDDCLGSANVQH